ncbi:MAG: ATP-dependent zinc metalloprotease FtsH [Planctomycetota bacterium]
MSQPDPNQDKYDKSDKPDRNDGDKGEKGNKPGRGGPGGKPSTLMGRGALGWVLLAGLAVALVLMLSNARNAADEVTWQEFRVMAQQDQLEDIKVSESAITATVKAQAEGDAEGSSNDRRRVAILREQIGLVTVELDEMGIKYTNEPSNNLLPTLLITFGPVLLIALLIYFFFIRAMRSAGGGPGGMLGSFGRSKHRMMNKEHSTIMLADVAGIEEAKDEVTEIIEFLKNPKKFQRLGGRVPRGVLLIGEPGCGKTLLAKAVAGEADVPFFSISGSDFVEMFVGVGASRVRDLFKQAKESAPCIIFLDEIDAVGRKRGSGFNSGGHDEREQTLNAILVEMDGFESSDQVIVMAATNRGDVLDKALTRPGRFDRSIQVPLPDIKGRMEILNVHARKVKMSPAVDLERLARGTPMVSGADLEAIINEAAISATMLGKDFVEQEDLEEARDKVRFGRSRKSHKVEEEERVATAYHEAGHAVAQVLLENADPLHKVTIIPRGRAMGATFSLPEKDRHGYGLKHLLDTMRVLCGGRIAEQRKTDDVSSGAAMDIQMMTSYARHMVLEWGMSDKLGFVNYNVGDDPNTLVADRPYGAETARVIDEEVRRMADEAYGDCTRLLDKHWEQVTAIAEALLKYETLTSDEVDKLMKGEPLGKPTVSELIEAEKEKKAAATPPPPRPAVDPDEDAPPAGAMPSPA